MGSISICNSQIKRIKKQPIFYENNRSMKNGLFLESENLMREAKWVTVKHFKNRSVSEGGDVVYLVILQAFFFSKIRRRI